MANIQRNFIRGRMNKSLDERLVPNGEYIDALNVRLGSTEGSEIGSVENSKGNTSLTTLMFNEIEVSNNARCIGAYEDGANETLYWFVHDPSFASGFTSKLDLIVSYNTNDNSLTYHVISIDDGTNLNTTLNFSPHHLITGINLVDNELLFFTDNLNPPRYINVNRRYSVPVNNLDNFSAESLLVIKRPPIEAPTFQALNIVGQEDDFLEDRFICFAYRYKYADNQYSATSQFSKEAFSPGSFNFSYNSYLNEGMKNTKNAAIITFNSGSSLVQGIQLLFKESTTNNIKVIEYLDKNNLGYSDNTNYTYTFDNSQIFTLLPDSELLRLYDNVPLVAKAQTLMGNRLMYGNYKEGYNLKDKFDQDIKLEFSAALNSTVIDSSSLLDSTGGGNYTFGPTPVTVPNSVVYFDLSNQNGTTLELTAGSSITLDFTILHSQFTGTTPTAQTGSTTLVFDYTLPIDFNNVYDLATSTDFIEKVGTSSNIQTVTNACNGSTLTDQVNCALPATLGTYTKTASGINATGEPINIIASPASNTIGLQLIAMNYVDGGNNSYEFYAVSAATATFGTASSPSSLHSNRGYEIGIVYMDNFNRASTALVSPSNSVYIPCSNSINKNDIRVTIPQQQLAPSWATRYKLVLKPSESTYETIFTNIYYEDPASNATYFLLEGENANKVEEGDRYFVKSDSNGPILRCVEATVLEKKSQTANFITVYDSAQNQIQVPAGTYMKINPSNFSTTVIENDVVAEGSQTVQENSSGDYPILAYPINLPPPSGTGNHVDYTVPAGSRINISIRQERLGPGQGDGNCEKRINTIDVELIASQDYANMSEWFYGDNVSTVFTNRAVSEVGGNGSPVVNTWEAATSGTGAPDTTSPSSDISTAVDTNYYRTYRNNTTNELFLLVTGTVRCGGVASRAKRRSSVTVDIEVYRSGSVIAFETKPADASPSIWYENHLSFPISADGMHTGNVQTQTSSQSAIVDSEFSNCYTFGNGVESYKILDSLTGKTKNFGERVTSTSNMDYKEEHRFADITYSGVFNDESNVNKLNEFNLGLLNFKPLEESYGPIQLLDGRKTDILTLQEDKISYVLTEKNLLSDSTGGGAVTSVPEVLGTQIARTEEYGISENPESYSSYGPNKYFTDAKRGAVINLIGSSMSNEQLRVISEAGMRGWFRDLFIRTFNTQKLGGFDPYMNEYVLHSNVQLPQPSTDCFQCNTTRDLTVLPGQTLSYCVDLENLLGVVDIDFVIPFQGFDNIVTELNSNTVTETNSNEIVAETTISGVGYTITAVYNGVSHTTGVVYQDGTLSFNKNSVTADKVQINVSHNSTSAQTIDITTGCPQAASMTVFNVAVTSNADASQRITNVYSWTDGSFTSNEHSSLVTFSSSNNNPIVSQYTQVNGSQGGGIIPGDGATVSIISRKNSGDNFVFDASKNKLRYLRTSTFYDNNATDINALLSASTNVTPISSQTNPNQFVANFTLPAGGSFLYIVWDYRKSNSQKLCYSSTSTTDACTGCTFPPVPAPTSPVPVTPVYRWLIEPGSGSVTSPATCPFSSVPLYSTASSFATTFANSTVFYTDVGLTTLFQGGNNYFGVREPNQGYGQSQGIMRMTNLGTASNIDTAGVCNPNPTPVPVPVPVPAPVSPTPVPVPTTPVPAPSVSTNAFTMTSINTYWSNQLDACANGPSASMQTYYTNAPGSCPQGAPGNMNYIYIDAAGTTLLSDVVNTAGRYYYIPSSSCFGAGNGQIVQIGSQGYINTRINC